MRLTLKTALTLLLCLCLLPVSALADGALRFTLRAQLDPAALPASMQESARGIADLMAITAAEGTFACAPDGRFDLSAALTLSDKAATRTAVRIYGTPGAWYVKSSLLGSETVEIDLGGLLQFAMKGYHHLSLPLQRAALLVSPHVHVSAFAGLYEPFAGALLTGESLRVGQAELIALAQTLSAVAAEDQRLSYWIDAVALEAGYDEALRSCLADLPAWVASFTDEDGLTITRDASGEVWQAGGRTLYARQAGGAWQLELPATPGGLTLSGSGHADEIHLCLTDAGGDALLKADVTAAHLPSSVPVTQPFSLHVAADGLLLPGAVDLHASGVPTGDGLALSVSTGGADAFLTLQLGLTPIDLPAPAFTADDLSGYPVLTSNDVTLAAFLQRIAQPLITGLWPLLVEIPASSFQTLMNALEDSGILGVLTESMSGGYGD